jgi:hypothetical protein
LTPEEWKILFQETQQKLELRKVQEEKLQDQEIKRVMFWCPKHAASMIDTELAEPPKGSPKKRKRGCKSTQKAIIFAYPTPSQPPPESVFIDIAKNESAPKITVIPTTKHDILILESVPLNERICLDADMGNLALYRILRVSAEVGPFSSVSRIEYLIN